MAENEKSKTCDVNELVISGRIVTPPERKMTQAQKTWCTFRISNTRFAGYVDEKPAFKTRFYTVKCWDANATFALEHLGPGAWIIVKGEIEAVLYNQREYFAVNAAQIVHPWVPQEHKIMDCKLRAEAVKAHAAAMAAPQGGAPRAAMQAAGPLSAIPAAVGPAEGSVMDFTGL